MRFCERCRKSVYNVAQLSTSEAIAVIERAEGRACMQLTRRRDGTIVTGDCWAQLRRARKRGLLALVAAGPAILAAQLWSQAFGLRGLAGLFQGARPAAPSTIRGGIGIKRHPPDFSDVPGGVAFDDEEVVLGGLVGPASKSEAAAKPGWPTARSRRK